MRSLAEIPATDPGDIARILSEREPAVLRGLAADWPIVRAAAEGGTKWLRMLRANATDAPVDALIAAPEAQGRFHYRGAALAMNFARRRMPLNLFLEGIEQEAMRPDGQAIAAQGLSAHRYLPGFAETHPMGVVPDGAEPRLWIGTAGKVATHNDPTDNVAVVAAGRRRFTLFPPSAEADLYMGPKEPSPAGTPISMVHVTAPDLDRYPRYANAEAVALQADLDPGDAIFIPVDWFHHVEAMSPANLLVNYWWPATT